MEEEAAEAEEAGARLRGLRKRSACPCAKDEEKEDEDMLLLSLLSVDDGKKCCGRGVGEEAGEEDEDEAEAAAEAIGMGWGSLSLSPSLSTMCLGAVCIWL